MKFNALKVFRGNTIEDVRNYLNTQLKAALKQIQIGLERLDLNENFDGFQKSVIIQASTEIAVPNAASYIPSKMLVVKQQGGGLITMGDRAWTTEQLTLKNNGGSDALATIIFMR